MDKGQGFKTKVYVVGMPCLERLYPFSPSLTGREDTGVQRQQHLHENPDFFLKKQETCARETIKV
jgi:hypothetical protein